MAVNWKDVTWGDLCEAISKLLRPNIATKHIFNVIVFTDDSEGEQMKFAVIVEDGKVTIKDGHIEEEAAVPFHIKRGGVETMIAMQIDGLNAAMRFMFDGSIHTTDPSGAQKWFEIFMLGEEALKTALEKALGGDADEEASEVGGRRSIKKATEGAEGRVPVRSSSCT